MSQLTERQAAFIDAYCHRGLSAEDSACWAGFAPGGYGARLLENPTVLAAIRAETQRTLVEDAPASLKVLRELRDSAGTPARTRADIGIKLLALAGYVAPTSQGAGAPEKQLSEMSADELHAYIERNRSEIDRLEYGFPSRGEEVNAPANAPPADLLEPKPMIT